jgi:AcrR family transcriptional regulator
MGAQRGTGSEPAGGDPEARWRARAVERSLRNARARAMTRSDRFIAAANQLLIETGRTDFTVQEIVERSKMSLRSFYQHFASKDDLLLALFEELIREWVARLRVQVLRSDDPVEQLRTYINGMVASVPEDTAPSRALTIYHLRLAETHPSEFAHALSPQVDLLLEILETGAAAGRFRRDIDPGTLAVILSQTLVSTLHTSVLGAQWAGQPIGADALVAFCFGAVGASAAAAPVRAAKRPRRA